ncbi:MAG TPA: bifunctional DNA primase/polymerase [Devosia sp.]|uniref:bifunctional DNA primase/polymerase n=1 Tax=Devosia sp. TaxID=1871048 RepID=UPI002F95E772
MGLFKPEDIAKLSGVSVEALPASGTEQLYMPGETLFGAVAMDARERGWAIFPQERTLRLPSRIDGKHIKISAYFEFLPTIEETRRWSLQAAGSNGAVLMGHDGLFTLDLDCGPERARAAIDLAFRILGPTPLVRDGSRPALLYRLAGKPKSRTAFFDDGEDAVELLGHGKALTAFGQHHKTGRYFTWRGSFPWNVAPTAAPVVNQAQVDAFFSALIELGQMRSRPTKMAEITIDGQTVTVPAGEGWTLDADGLVSDGRDAFMWSLSREIVRTGDRDDGELNRIRLKSKVLGAFLAAQSPSRAWDKQRAKAAVSEKVDRGMVRVATGQLGGGMAAVQPVFEQPSPFPWIDPRGTVRAEFTNGDDAARADRTLQTDRTVIGAKVTKSVKQGLRDYLDDVVAGVDAVHALNAPTGAGKTRKAIAEIADDARLRGKTLAFALPTYQNIDEALQAADKAGLKAMPYQGKLALCQRADEMKLVQDAGKSNAGMCRSRLTSASGIVEDVQCTFYHSCEAIAQKSKIAASDIVFLPKAFLDVELPDELKAVDGLVIDESFFGSVVHRGDIPVDAFHIPRPEPKPNRDDVDHGRAGADLLRFRRAAADIVTKAFLDGLDPADVLASIPNGLELARFAKRVCGAAITSVHRITPTMSPAKLAAWVVEPESEHVRTEHRFWSIAIARVEALLADKAQAEIYGPKRPYARGGQESQYQLLGGDTVRISWMSEPNWSDKPTLLLDASGDPEITRRIFPRRKIKTTTVPADLNVRVMAVLDRRFALRTILPPADATPEERMAAAQVIHEIRQAISAIAGFHANGHVVVHLNLAVRRIVELDWLKSANVDILHPGAVAGLDFARNHVAAFSVGRMELPVSEIDSQVAALTSNDAIPEAPIDVTGTGVDELGKTIYPHVVTRSLPLRDGRNVSYRTQEHAGPMARAVQAQHREEAVRQFIGRLRPIFRDDTPYVYIAGQAIPDDLIVDEVCSWQDILNSGAKYWDAVRAAGGIISTSLMTAADKDTGTIEDYSAWVATLGPEVLANYHSVGIAWG